VVAWLRHDLRLRDNPVLQAAAEEGRTVVPVFVWSPEDHAWAEGGASSWWLGHSLKSLDSALRKKGSALVMRRGWSPAAELLDLCREVGSDRVVYARVWEPRAIAADGRVERALSREGISARVMGGQVLFPLEELRNKSGGVFKTFSSFFRACGQAQPPAEPAAAPASLPAPRPLPATLTVEQLGLAPDLEWTAGLRATWEPGEKGAWRRLERFLEYAVAEYEVERDRPDHEGTSRLSPHLRFGEISPADVWYAVLDARQAAPDDEGAAGPGGLAFLRQLGWREYSYYVLLHHPHTLERPLRPEFEAFPWQDDPDGLEAWRLGCTGYPLVDAGMRQLRQTGWMHNRVRMVAASFLVKHLLVPWQVGAEWFLDTLVDADPANNTQGWQWTAGSGTDAAPYFRIFNPVLQGQRFDPNGAYITRYVPELEGLSPRFVHRPWEAPADERMQPRGSGAYPAPVIDHIFARERALSAFAEMKGRVGSTAASP